MWCWYQVQYLHNVVMSFNSTWKKICDVWLIVWHFQFCTKRQICWQIFLFIILLTSRVPDISRIIISVYKLKFIVLWKSKRQKRSNLELKWVIEISFHLWMRIKTILLGKGGLEVIWLWFHWCYPKHFHQQKLPIGHIILTLTRKHFSGLNSKPLSMSFDPILYQPLMIQLFSNDVWL